MAISFAVRTVVLLPAISPFVSVSVSFLQIVVFFYLVLFICVFGGWTLLQVVFLFALFLLSPRAAEWRRRQNIATIKAEGAQSEDRNVLLKKLPATIRP